MFPGELIPGKNVPGQNVPRKNVSEMSWDKMSLLHLLKKVEYVAHIIIMIKPMP